MIHLPQNKSGQLHSLALLSLHRAENTLHALALPGLLIDQ